MAQMSFFVEKLPEHFEKLGASAEALRGMPGDTDVLAAIMVTDDNYVPAGVEVREHFGPRLFTALIPAASIKSVLDDPKVETVDPSRRLMPMRRP